MANEARHGWAELPIGLQLLLFGGLFFLILAAGG
ncbi:MAG: hypothetical protein KatS3mg060_1608 [Dehalococcoidia bacterium]|nr:MAG: hypothetical protein KatS3mg060_1608 [Dehalococcoidia bacterium]